MHEWTAEISGSPGADVQSADHHQLGESSAGGGFSLGQATTDSTAKDGRLLVLSGTADASVIRPAEGLLPADLLL